MSYRALLAALALFWVAATTQAETLVTVAAEAGSWQPDETGFAQVSARRQAVLSLPFAVRITGLSAEPGARVAAGDELARFDAPLLRQHLAAWDQARLELRLTQKRLKVLLQSERAHAVTRSELALGEQAVARARGGVRVAWETLAGDLDLLHVPADSDLLAKQLEQQTTYQVAHDLGRLLAPFAGIVTERRTALGEQLTAGTPILELEALQHVYLDVGVSEATLPFWQGGQSHWRTGGRVGNLQPVPGTPRYDPDSGLWLLRFVADNPGLTLRDRAWVEVEHKGAAQSVVWVPASAVVARNGQTWCIVPADGSTRVVKVQVGGAAVAGRIPLLTGLSQGDPVVTEGAYELLYRDLKDLIRFED